VDISWPDCDTAQEVCLFYAEIQDLEHGGLS